MFREQEILKNILIMYMELVESKTIGFGGLRGGAQKRSAYRIIKRTFS